jgi:hypothetical protein
MRAAYLDAAAIAAALLRDPAVARRWTRPSALEGFTVGGLAAHLGAQVVNVTAVLAADLPADARVLTLPEHYGSVAWIGADIDTDANAAIRAGGEKTAADGPAAVVARVEGALADLRAALPAERGERPVLLPWTGWALTLDDLLVTRMMEIAVHGDDLAVSVDVPTPTFPEAVFAPVVALLTGLAARRHGQPALLRALSRAERAPATVSAL